MHWGIDLAGPLGSPILATGDGVVVKAGPQDGFGNAVMIQHANGDVTLYGHMRYLYVKAGQTVTAGEKIALVGNEGFSTGPHLHLEVHQGGIDGARIDPVPWLKERGIDLSSVNSSG
jgi:murein DD-endopeptidase MepM/ murein hydrolase activator NlpD